MTQPLPNTARLLAIMARLRDRQGGCPWDIEQTFATIAPYTIEEAYEVAEAIHNDDMPALREELGDLLLQVVFHAQMAGEAKHFDFEDVAGAIADKMIRRHPHVFGEAEQRDAESQTASWEAQKAEERAAKGTAGTFDGIAETLPALIRAVKLQKRAARVGFDWARSEDILDKIEEEIGELRAEMASGDSRERIADELGDLLFAVTNLARRLDIDPETALLRSNAKFKRRFGWIEAWLAEAGRSPEQSNLDEMEALWQRAKQEERK